MTFGLARFVRDADPMIPVVLGVLLAAAPPSPGPARESPGHPGGVHLAAKVLAGNSSGVGRATSWFGPGVDLEIDLTSNGWQLEVASALFLGGGDGLAVPIELLVKKVFRGSKTVDLFVAGGGTVHYVRHGHAVWMPGGAAVLGAHLWQDDRFALLIELGYAALSHHGALEHDLEGGVGIVFRP